MVPLRAISMLGTVKTLKPKTFYWIKSLEGRIKWLQLGKSVYFQKHSHFRTKISTWLPFPTVPQSGPTPGLLWSFPLTHWWSPLLSPAPPLLAPTPPSFLWSPTRFTESYSRWGTFIGYVGCAPHNHMMCWDDDGVGLFLFSLHSTHPVPLQPHSKLLISAGNLLAKLPNFQRGDIPKPKAERPENRPSSNFYQSQYSLKE